MVAVASSAAGAISIDQVLVFIGVLMTLLNLVVEFLKWYQNREKEKENPVG